MSSKQSVTRRAMVDDNVLKQPPSAVMVEKWVLGALLNNGQLMVDVNYLLKPSDFYIDLHAEIFQEMQVVFDRGQSIDLVFIAQRLIEKSKNTSQENIPHYLISLSKDVQRDASILDNCLIIKEKSVARQIYSASRLAVASVMNNEDPFETLDKLGDALKNITLDVERKQSKSLVEIAQSYMEEWNRNIKVAMSNEVDPNAVYTFIQEWDRINGRLQPGLYIIAGRPGMGKTSLIITLLNKMACRFPVGFMNLEMTDTQILRRLACNKGRISNDLLKKSPRFVTEQETQKLFSAVEDVTNELKLYISSDTHEVGDIIAKFRYWKAKYDIKVGMLDYLQLVQLSESEKKYKTETDVLNTVMKRLRLLSLELQMPILILSQLNRDGQKTLGEVKEPTLAHLKGSGMIEEFAFQVAFIHRPEYYDQSIAIDEMGESTKGLTHLIIAKHRDGSVGRVQLKSELEYFNFTPWTQEFTPPSIQVDLGFSRMGDGIGDSSETPF